jgi:hypothetical protein
VLTKPLKVHQMHDNIQAYRTRKLKPEDARKYIELVTT